MNDWLLKKIDLFIKILAFLGLLVLLVFTSQLEIKDFDLWLHLAVGKYILVHKIIPQTDFLSCTVFGQPWVNHEWLYQVVVYTLSHYFGVDGIITFQSLVFTLIFVALFAVGLKKENFLFLLLGLYLVFDVFRVRVFLRPDTLSLLFYILFVWILAKGLRDRRSLWCLFILQIVWVNTHGFFILGPMITLIFLGGEWLKRHVSLPFFWNNAVRLDNEEYSRLKKIFLCTLLACLVNPSFIHGALYPFKILFSLPRESQIFFEKISELMKPLSWGNLFSLEYLSFKLLMVISVLSFFLNRRRLNVSLLLLWVFMLVFSLQAIRNMLFFAVTAFIVIVTNFEPVLAAWTSSGGEKREKYLVMASVFIHLVLIFQIKTTIESLVLRGYYDFDRFERKAEYARGVSLRNYPYKAVDFLVENNIKGNFFNDFNSGAYILGRTFPDIKVFIDGRTEVYGAEFFNAYNKIWSGDGALFEEAVKRYHLTGAFLNSIYVPVPSEFIRYMYNHPEWKLVYFNYDAAIFLKDIEENKLWIKQFSIDLTHWKTPQTDLLKLGIQHADPYQNISRAEALFNLRLYDQAWAETNEALKISPDYEPAYKMMAKIYFERKDYLLCFENARKAKLLDPYDQEVRYYISASAYYLGDFDLAYKQCEKILLVKRNQSKVLFLLAMVYAKQQKYPEAFHALKEAHRSDQKNIESVLKVADVFIEERQYDLARHAYQIAYRIKPDDVSLRKKMEELPKEKK